MRPTCLAHAIDAYHPVHHALEAQTTEKVASFLLGSLPEIRREWEAEAGDDSCRVRSLSFSLSPFLTGFSSNAIRNDLVRPYLSLVAR